MAAQILLLRHAEEPRDPNDPDLSAAGRLRAERLATHIPATFGRPDFIIAAAPNKRSVRAYLTVRPLALTLRAQIDTRFKSKSDALAALLLSDKAYSGKLVIVCWTHTELPSLASALKARARDYPDPWDEDLFDLILRFEYPRAGKPNLTRVAQPF